MIFQWFSSRYVSWFYRYFWKTSDALWFHRTWLAGFTNPWRIHGPYMVCHGSHQQKPHQMLALIYQHHESYGPMGNIYIYIFVYIYMWYMYILYLIGEIYFNPFKRGCPNMSIRINHWDSPRIRSSSCGSQSSACLKIYCWKVRCCKVALGWHKDDIGKSCSHMATTTQLHQELERL